MIKTENRRLLVIANVTNTHTHRFIYEFEKRGWEVFVLSIQPPNEENRAKFGRKIIPLAPHKIYELLIKLPFFRYSQFHNINSGVRWFEPYSVSAFFAYLLLILRVKSKVKSISPAGIFSIYLTMNGFLAALSKHPRVVSSAAGADVSNFNKLSLSYWGNHPVFLRKAVRGAYRVLGFDKEAFAPQFSAKKCGLKNIHWINHWGVDIEKFCPARVPSPADKERACIFICSRPFRPQFDFDGILLSLKKIWEEGTRFQFKIATGSRSRANSEFLDRLIHQLKCDSFVQLFDHIDYQELPTFLQTGDVWIDPINIEKFPETGRWGVSGSLLEAMACGLIPVISERPSTNWVLPQKARPYIYRQEENGLTRALRNALRDKNDDSIRGEMREAVVHNANWQKNLTDIENFFLKPTQN